MTSEIRESRSIVQDMTEQEKAQSATLQSEEPSIRPGTFANLRRWKRYKLDVPIRVIIHGPTKTSLFDGRGNELSEGGMALTAGVELRSGDEVEIEFTPPSGSPIRVRGKVCNRTGYRYGIEFLTGCSQDAERTDRLRQMFYAMSSS
jgi:hypothetical protein